MAHRCNEACVCLFDGKPLFYSPATGEHACMDPDCVNAHGLLEVTLSGARIEMTWEVDEMDRRVTEALQTAVRDGIAGSVALETPVLTYEELLETASSVKLIQEEIHRQQREDMRRVEEAYVRAIELDQGVFVATRQGRVVYAEPSPWVPASTAYWANTDAWKQYDMNDLFSGRFAPDID